MSIPLSTKSSLSFLPVVFQLLFQMNRNGCAGLMKCGITENFLKAFSQPVSALTFFKLAFSKHLQE